MKIGILGAGQLGRMLAHAGFELGLDVKLYDQNDDPSANIYKHLTRGPFDDRAQLAEFARQLDLVTFEFENVPLETLRQISCKTPVLPGLDALEASQDRWIEKRLFQRLGIPTAQFFDIPDEVALSQAVQTINGPCVLKTRRFGYDGKGQAVIRSESDVRDAYQRLQGVPLILEEFVAFDREVSAIAVRSASGDIKFYPLCENHHEQGILRWTKPWKQAPATLSEQTHQHVNQLLNHLNYVGVLVLEFFEKNGKLIANEFAPRVHNSGHWTIEGAVTSQFENHMRACAGLPLGSTEVRDYPAMVNLIGHIPSPSQILAETGWHLHDYGKKAAKNRKVGHVGITALSEQERDLAVEKVMTLIRQMSQ